MNAELRISKFQKKIIEIVATRCHVLKLKCTKFEYGWGSAPDPAGGAYSAPPVPQLDLRGPTSKEREGRKERMEAEGRGEGMERKGRRGGGEEDFGAFPKQFNQFQTRYYTTGQMQQLTGVFDFTLQDAFMSRCLRIRALQIDIYLLTYLLTS